ncbi:MAG TPA: ketoacyl-ACP synthase III [Candidatus Krumholzibacteria bacterium]|nr:ketoacyl-ACP synthase III [Candidatus Krumholzibacteria bacterium]
MHSMDRRTIWSTIVGTGSYIPEKLVPNQDFLHHEFYSPDGEPFQRSTREIVDKFEAITGIAARRHVPDNMVTSDIAYMAADAAIQSAGVDRESLDYIVVAHNFGDITAQSRRSEMVPTIAARVKNRLAIKNPATVAYDLPFGCAGWLQAVIQADYFIRSGDAKRALIIGAETLSRVCDPHDRDSMIYADGAGACVLEATVSDTPVGVIAHMTRSDADEHAHLLHMGASYGAQVDSHELFLKMQGHKLYEYALRHVPRAIRDCITRAGLSLGDISKVLLHQANAKMDDAILERVYKLFGATPPPLVMPMTISWLGNSSVATLPTLLDLLVRGKIENQELAPRQNIVLASVGAGMNINALVYAIPGAR